MGKRQSAPISPRDWDWVPRSGGHAEDPPNYAPEVLDDIALTLNQTPPGEWAELALCPGPFGCPYASTEAALADGVEQHFCPACRVIHLYARIDQKPRDPTARARFGCYCRGMLTDIACRALRQGKVLDLRYDGFSRHIEVHACGYTKQGHAVLRGWQVSGGSGERQGWKLLRLDDVSDALVSDQASGAPRKGFKLGDPAMARILGELSPRR